MKIELLHWAALICSDFVVTLVAGGELQLIRTLDLTEMFSYPLAISAFEMNENNFFICAEVGWEEAEIVRINRTSGALISWAGGFYYGCNDIELMESSEDTLLVVMPYSASLVQHTFLTESEYFGWEYYISLDRPVQSIRKYNNSYYLIEGTSTSIVKIPITAALDKNAPYDKLQIPWFDSKAKITEGVFDNNDMYLAFGESCNVACGIYRASIDDPSRPFIFYDMPNSPVPSRIQRIILTNDYAYALDSLSASLIRWPKNPKPTSMSDDQALFKIQRVRGQNITMNRRTISFVVARSDQVITIERRSNSLALFDMFVYNCTEWNFTARSSSLTSLRAADPESTFELSLDSNSGNIVVQGPGVKIKEYSLSRLSKFYPPSVTVRSFSRQTQILNLAFIDTKTAVPFKDYPDINLGGLSCTQVTWTSKTSMSCLPPANLTMKQILLWMKWPETISLVPFEKIITFTPPTISAVEPDDYKIAKPPKLTITSPDLKDNISKIEVYFLRQRAIKDPSKKFQCTNVTRVNDTAVTCQGPILCSSTVHNLILELEGLPSEPFPRKVGGQILKSFSLGFNGNEKFANTDGGNTGYLYGENLGLDCPENAFEDNSYEINFYIPWNNVTDIGYDKFAALGVQSLGLIDMAQSDKFGIYLGWSSCKVTDDRSCRIYPPAGVGTNISLVVATSQGTRLLLENAYSYAPPSIISIKPTALKSSATNMLMIEGANFAYSSFSNPYTVDLEGFKIFVHFHHTETGERFTCSSPQMLTKKHISCIFPELAPGKYYVRLTIARRESEEVVIYTELNNRAPIVQPLNATVARNEIVQLTVNAADPDNDRITYRIASDPKNGQLFSWSRTAPNNAGYEMSSNFVLSTESFLYRPFVNFYGEDTFGMVAEDPFGLTTNFTVNVLTTFALLPARPIASNLVVYGLQDEKTQIRIQATNFDGDTIPEYVITKLPSRGVLWDKALQKRINSALYYLSTSEPFADLEFEPSPGESGNNYAGFLWNCRTDKGLTMPQNATVSIQIQAVNRAPIAYRSSAFLLEGQNMSIALKANDSDGDFIPNLIIRELPKQGVLYQATENGTIANAILSPSVRVENSNHLVWYQPKPYYNGFDQFSFYAVDQNSAYSSEALVELEIEPVNQAPEIQNELKVVFVDGQEWNLTISVIDHDGEPYLGLAFLEWPTRGIWKQNLKTSIFLNKPIRYEFKGPGRITKELSLFAEHDLKGGGNPYATLKCYVLDSLGMRSTNNLTVHITVDCQNKINLFWRTEGPACGSCPTGAICSPTGEFLPYNKAGYYPTPDINVFLPCDPPEACPSANPFALRSEYDCAQGYAGPRCGKCQKLWYRKQNSCQPCGDNRLPLGGIIFLAIMALLVLLGLLLLIRKLDAGFVSITLTYWQSIAMLMTFRLNWSPEVENMFYILSLFNLNLDFTAPECYMLEPSNVYVWKWFIIMLTPLALFCLIICMIFVEIIWRKIRAKIQARAILNWFGLDFVQPKEYGDGAICSKSNLLSSHTEFAIPDDSKAIQSKLIIHSANASIRGKAMPDNNQSAGDLLETTITDNDDEESIPELAKMEVYHVSENVDDREDFTRKHPERIFNNTGDWKTLSRSSESIPNIGSHVSVESKRKTETDGAQDEQSEFTIAHEEKFQVHNGQGNESMRVKANDENKLNQEILAEGILNSTASCVKASGAQLMNADSDNPEDQAEATRQWQSTLGWMPSTLLYSNTKDYPTMSSKRTGATNQIYDLEYDAPFTHSLLNLFWLFLLLAYYPLAKNSLEIFSCVQHGSESYFVREPSQKCYGTWWYQLFAPAVAGICIYVIGIPALTAAMLWIRQEAKQKERSQRTWFERQILFITIRQSMRFRSGEEYWDVVHLMRKLSVVICQVILLNQNVLQAIFLIIIFQLAAIAHAYFKPYQLKTLNRLEIATLASACLVLIGGIMFYVDQFPYPWQKVALSQVIIAMIATCTFAVIASMIIHMRAIYLKRSRLRMTNDKKSSLARLESARDLVATAPE